MVCCLLTEQSEYCINIYIVSPKKRPPFYFSNNSVRNWRISIIFGVLHPEKIWHQQLVHLPSLPVYCSHFTLGNPKKSFSTVLFTDTSDYLCYLRRNKLQLLCCSLSVYLLLFTASYYLRSPTLWSFFISLVSHFQSHHWRQTTTGSFQSHQHLEERNITFSQM